MIFCFSSFPLLLQSLLTSWQTSNLMIKSVKNQSPKTIDGRGHKFKFWHALGWYRTQGQELIFWFLRYFFLPNRRSKKLAIARQRRWKKLSFGGAGRSGSGGAEGVSGAGWPWHLSSQLCSLDAGAVHLPHSAQVCSHSKFVSCLSHLSAQATSVQPISVHLPHTSHLCSHTWGTVWPLHLSAQATSAQPISVHLPHTSHLCSHTWDVVWPPHLSAQATSVQPVSVHLPHTSHICSHSWDG